MLHCQFKPFFPLGYNDIGERETIHNSNRTLNIRNRIIKANNQQGQLDCDIIHKYQCLPNYAQRCPP